MKKLILYPVLALLLLLVVVRFWPEKGYKPFKVDAAYQAQVDAFNLPSMPSDWTWHKFQAADGTQVAWGETGNRNAAKASLIWVPGYTANIEMYGEHFDRLARMGFHVIGLDLRGQGRSERHRESHPEKLWVEDFKVYSDDVAAFINQLNLPEGRPLILSGISFGGHVVTRSTVEHDLDIDALYLIVPALKPKSDPYDFEQALWLMNFSRGLGKANHYAVGQKDWFPVRTDFSVGDECSANPKRLFNRDTLFARHPELRVGGVTNQWGAEFFESSLVINNPDFLGQINVPVTIISADADNWVHTADNSKACADYISDCRELMMESAGHCLPQERDDVVDQIINEFDVLLDRSTSESN